MKKKPEEMTQKEALEEFEKVTEELERLAPKFVGHLIKVNKRLYALTKDETGRRVLMESLKTDKDLRKSFFQYASALEDLKKTSLKVEDELTLKIMELKKKLEESKE